MTAKPIVLRDKAVSDIDEAITYYAREAGTDIALAFVDALEKAYEHIARYPASGSPRLAHELDLPGLRSWHLRRFPYQVFYVEVEEHIDVWRVLHDARDMPEWLRETSPT